MVLSDTVRYKLFSLYFTVSAFCWSALLVRLGILLPLVGKKFLPGGIADYFLTLQSACSTLDFLSYVTGNIKFNWKALFADVSSRFFISYAVIFSYPKVARTEFFSVLILAWGLDELIKYIYFGYKLKSRNIYKIPAAVSFIYQNSFIVLFPARCVCEMCLTFLSLKYIEDERQKNLFRVILVAYLPAAYICFKSMYSRRGAKTPDHAKKD